MKSLYGLCFLLSDRFWTKSYLCQMRNCGVTVATFGFELHKSCEVVVVPRPVFSKFSNIIVVSTVQRLFDMVIRTANNLCNKNLASIRHQSKLVDPPRIRCSQDWFLSCYPNWHMSLRRHVLRLRTASSNSFLAFPPLLTSQSLFFAVANCCCLTR